MSIVTLFSDGESWIASERLVYAADERRALEDVATQSARLGELVATREAALADARERAREEGLEIGRAEGRAAAAEEIAAALDALREGAARERVRRRDALVTLALGVVRRIADDVAPVERLAALARTAAAELVDEPRLTLHVHPSRREALRARLCADEASSAAAGERRGVDAVVADAALGPEEAYLETAGGRVAIDLDTQLDTIAEHLAADPAVAALVDGEEAS